MRDYFCFCCLFVRVTVAEQLCFAPGWADDGQTDGKAHHGSHGDGEVGIAGNGREISGSAASDLVTVCGVDLPGGGHGWADQCVEVIGCQHGIDAIVAGDAQRGGARLLIGRIIQTFGRLGFDECFLPEEG